MKAGWLALAAIVFGLSLEAAAQKIPMRVLYSKTDDRVGAQFVFELKEAIRGSHAARLIPDQDASKPHIVLDVSSLDISVGGTGLASAIAIGVALDSAEMPLGGAYIGRYLHQCGNEKAAHWPR
jgi:hypothetical protein